MGINKCVICGGVELEKILDYGKVALADSFLLNNEEIQKEIRYQLTLAICSNCMHVQILEHLNPEMLFKHYVWETGVSKSIIDFSLELYSKLIGVHKEKAENLPKVIEIASNDGSILTVFKKNGCDVLGVDPAKNIAKTANERGIETIADFFNYETAKFLIPNYGKMDICIARNVLGHVSDIHGVVKGIKTILNPNGFAVVEVPHLLTMFDELQYDQVFHEHISYHSLNSIKNIFMQYDMEVFNIDEIWIHGGSIRIFLQHKNGPRKIDNNVEKVLKKEIPLFSISSWKDFAKRAGNHKEALFSLLNQLKEDEKKIAIYGASGKGQSLLQFCNINSQLIDYVIDKSDMKEGKYTPGTHIKIYKPSHIYQDKPDVMLLCAWNFAKEIKAQEMKFCEEGGKFLVPFPSPHFI